MFSNWVVMLYIYHTYIHTYHIYIFIIYIYTAYIRCIYMILHVRSCACVSKLHAPKKPGHDSFP